MPHRVPNGTNVAASVAAHWRSVPLLVKAATGAFFGLMLAMLYLYPVNYGPDEVAHFDMAYSYSVGHGVYAPGTRFLAQGIDAEQHFAFLGAPPGNSFADSPPSPRSARPSISQYGGDAPTDLPDQMTQHPPLYYLAGAAILAFPGVSGLAYDVQFSLLRLLSLVFLLPLPFLFWKTARQIGVGALAPAASLLPLLVPGMARAGASVTNDSLLILAFGVFTYLVSRVLTGDASRRTAAWLTAWMVIAILTKGFALQLPAIALIAYLVCARRAGKAVRVPALIVAGGAALGAVWWIHNVIAYGAVQPSGYPAHYNDTLLDGPGQGPGHLAGFILKFGYELITRFWGELGLLEPPSPNLSFVTGATVFLSVAVVAGLLAGIGSTYGRAAAGVLVLPLVFTAGIVAGGAWPDWARNQIAAGMQGRYLFPAFTGFGAVALLGVGRLVRGRGERAVAPLLVAAALFSQFWSYHRVLVEWWFPRRPMTHLSSYRATAAALLDWSPWPVGVSAVAAVVTLSALTFLIYAVLRRPVAGSPPQSLGSMTPSGQGPQVTGLRVNTLPRAPARRISPPWH